VHRIQGFFEAAWQRSAGTPSRRREARGRTSTHAASLKPGPADDPDSIPAASPDADHAHANVMSRFFRPGPAETARGRHGAEPA
jgi:hypothetical protein